MAWSPRESMNTAALLLREGSWQGSHHVGMQITGYSEGCVRAWLSDVRRK